VEEAGAGAGATAGTDTRGEIEVAAETGADLEAEVKAGAEGEKIHFGVLWGSLSRSHCTACKNSAVRGTTELFASSCAIDERAPAVSGSDQGTGSCGIASAGPGLLRRSVTAAQRALVSPSTAKATDQRAPTAKAR
jgi:hypothetical protein